MVEVSKHSLFRLKITVGRRLCAYPSIHFSLDEDTLKITVGCLTSAYPSVRKTLKITVGCPPCTYPSIRNKNFHTCGLWARPPVLSPVPVPSQAIHSRTGLFLHFRSCSMKTSLANDFAVVRLEMKEGPFDYRNISGEEFIFITVLNKFQKHAAGKNYSHYSFILIPKQ